MDSRDEILGDAGLDAFLRDSAGDVPAPSDALMARVLADAHALRPVPGARVGGGWLAGLLEALGGWKGAGGLVTAGIIGLWIGINPPPTLETTTAALWDAISPDLTGDWSGYDGLL